MLENKQYHQAVKFFSEFLINNPENVEALNGLAEGQHRSGDPMTAISTYQKSLLNESDQPEVCISIPLRLAMGAFKTSFKDLPRFTRQ